MKDPFLFLPLSTQAMALYKSKLDDSNQIYWQVWSLFLKIVSHCALERSLWIRWRFKNFVLLQDWWSFYSTFHAFMLLTARKTIDWDIERRYLDKASLLTGRSRTETPRIIGVAFYGLWLIKYIECGHEDFWASQQKLVLVSLGFLLAGFSTIWWCIQMQWKGITITSKIAQMVYQLRCSIINQLLKKQKDGRRKKVAVHTLFLFFSAPVIKLGRDIFQIWKECMKWKRLFFTRQDNL